MLSTCNQYQMILHQVDYILDPEHGFNLTKSLSVNYTLFIKGKVGLFGVVGVCALPIQVSSSLYLLYLFWMLFPWHNIQEY